LLTIVSIPVAASALPGDLLYPWKLGVLEPLEDLTALTARRKSEVALKHADRRLLELEAISGNSGSSGQVLRIEELFKKSALEIGPEEPGEQAVRAAKFEALLEAHNTVVSSTTQADSRQNEVLRHRLRLSIEQAEQQRAAAEQSLQHKSENELANAATRVREVAARMLADAESLIQPGTGTNTEAGSLIVSGRQALANGDAAAGESDHKAAISAYNLALRDAQRAKVLIRSAQSDPHGVRKSNEGRVRGSITEKKDSKVGQEKKSTGEGD
jgi:hypothetical protein